MPKLAMTGAELFPLSNELPTYGRTRRAATPRPRVENGEDATGVQVIPSDEVAIAAPPSPTATHTDPFHAIPYPAVENGEFTVTCAQEVPFVEVAIEASPCPTATHKDPFHATPNPLVENGEFTVTGVQLVPFVEVAIVLVPDPTATHKDPFHATPRP